MLVLPVAERSCFRVALICIRVAIGVKLIFIRISRYKSFSYLNIFLTRTLKSTYSNENQFDTDGASTKNQRNSVA